MKMTQLEQAAKKQIMDILNKQGYPTYSKLLQKLDVKLINTEKDPGSIAYITTDTATIYLNPGLSIEQVSTIVRHEILHEYLTHAARMQKLIQSDDKYKSVPHDIFNIAADYEISNKGYTDADKITSRGIKLNGKVLRGLVTEDDHPDWVDMTFEEMLDALMQETDNLPNFSMGDLNRQPPDEGDMEDIQDQAASLSGAAQDQADAGQESQEQADQQQAAADQINDEAEKAKDAIKQNSSSKSKNGGPFDTDEQKETDEEIAEKAKAFKDALNKLKDAIFEETDTVIEKERVAKAAQDAARYKDDPLSRFKASLSGFIKNEIATGRGATWTRMNKKYAGTGIIRPGTSRLAQSKVPLINVYFDRSGSWDSSKTIEGAKAIATLNKYVTQGQLKIKLYYFSNNVHSNEQDALNEGGTYGQPILDHIEATKPDNVIVLTDSDINDCESYIRVPGGVWMLFYGGRSEDLIDHLHGAKTTKYFDIDY